MNKEMTMKTYCDNCLNEEEFEERFVERTFSVKGTDVSTTIMIKICKNCGEEIWDNDVVEYNENQVFNEYRKITGIDLEISNERII